MTSAETGTAPESAAVSTAKSDFAIDTEQQSLRELVHAYLGRFRTGGDLGLAPAIAALLILTVVFGALRPESFLTRFNFGNFFTQAAPICVLAMGVTFVLLLGEIDLSAGYTAGVCAAVLASRLDAGDSLVVAVVLSFLAAVVMGLGIGWLVAKVGIPSFVVTLSTFLSFQGVLLLITKEGGTIGVDNEVIVALANKNLAVPLGWTLWALVTFGFAGQALNKVRARAAQGLTTEPVAAIAAKTVAIGVVWGAMTWLLNEPRGNNIRGVPIAVPVVLALVVVLTFILNRTRWGRHLYAAGGNPEAARRAGINVTRLRISAFVTTAALACIAGFILASRLNSVDPQTGGNDTLLIAVAAAVIGGTSLFGGRGRVINAVFGGMVFALINNGLPLLGELGSIDFSAAGPKFIVNGGVLLLFASIDALSRKRSAAA